MPGVCVVGSVRGSRQHLYLVRPPFATWGVSLVPSLGCCKASECRACVPLARLTPAETTPALRIQQVLSQCSLVNRADEARESGQVGRAGQREEVSSPRLWPCTKGLHHETFCNCANVSPGPPAPCCLLPGLQLPRGQGPGPAESTAEQAWARGPVRPPDRTPSPPLIKPPAASPTTLGGSGFSPEDTQLLSSVEKGRRRGRAGGETPLKSLWSN